MSNLPDDWRDEPPEHDDRCPMLCTDDECGDDHTCTCDDLAQSDAEAQAEAYAEYLYDKEP